MKDKKFMVIMINKKIYYTDDKDSVVDIARYGEKIDFGRKPNFPLLKDIKVIINPQYVVSIERINEKK